MRTPVRRQPSNNSSSSSEVKALLAARFARNFVLEVGPTYRLWGTYGSALGAEVNLALQFNRQFLFLIDRLIFGFGFVRQPTSLATATDVFGFTFPPSAETSTMFRLGIGFGI